MTCPARHAWLPALCVALATGLQAAEIPLRWEVETSRPARQHWPLLRGETVRLEPRILSYRQPVDLTGATVVLHARTNAMPAGVSFQAAGAAGRPGGAADAAQGWVHVPLAPSTHLPPDSEHFTYTIDITTTNGRVLRAMGSLRVSGTDRGDLAEPVEPVANHDHDGIYDPAGSASAAQAAAADYTDAAIAAIDLPDIDLAEISVVTAGGYRNPVYWRLSAEPVYRGFSFAETNIVDDVIAVTYEADGTFTDWQVEPDFRRGWVEGDPAWHLSPAGIASIDSAGAVTTSNAGIAVVSATIDGLSKSIRLPLRYVQGEQWTAWVRGVTGTVRRASGDLLDAKIAAAGPSPDVDLFSVMDHGTGTYAWNTNHWTWPEADFSGVVISSKHVGGSWGNAQWHGTLLTPRHIVLAKHTVDNVPNQVATKAEEVGTQKRFLGRSGTLYERTVVAHFDPFGDPDFDAFTGWNLGNDTIVGLLDYAVPTNDVAIYPVLPPDWLSYSPTRLRSQAPGVRSEGGAAGGLFTNLDRKGYGVELASPSGFRGTPWPPRASVHRIGRTGDSGRPVFLWLPGQMVFMFGLLYPTSGHNWAAIDPSIDMWFADYRARIEAILAMHGEVLTNADFDGYTRFEGSEQ